MSFRLLHVPQLILVNIIKLVNPSELFTLSLCSRRTYDIVNNLRAKSINWEIWVYCESNKQTCVDVDRISEPFNLLDVRHLSEAPASLETLEKVNINGHQVPCIIGKMTGSLLTYWEDLNFGLKTVVIYTFELLNKNYITAVMFGKETIWVLDWLISIGMTIEDGVVESSEKLTDEEYGHILRNCKSKSLSIYAPPSPGFRYQMNFHQDTSIVIEPGSWVTFDNLMAMDISSILICKSNLTCADINQYLKSWLSRDGSPRLKYLSVELDSLVIEDFLNGIEEKFRLVQNRREYTWTDGATRAFNWSYDTKRDDGVNASFSLRIAADNGAGGVSGEFMMFVWPDSTGKSYPEPVDLD